MIDKQFKKEYDKVKREYFLELLKLKPEKGLKNVNAFRNKALWAWKNIEPRMHITFGNAKLPETTCIVNLGTWFNCSGRKEGFCEICQECYDKSPEVRFKQRTKDRIEHEIYWRSISPEKFANELIQEILEHDNKKSNKTKLIRWAEVGEIRNQQDLQKIINISNIIDNILGIKSYIYTHNKNLNFNINRPSLTINGSNFMVDNEYRVSKEKENELKQNKTAKNCICDCTQCSYCSKKDGFIIIEELR